MSPFLDELWTILQLPRGIVCPQPREVYITLPTDISNRCKKANATFQCVKQAVPSAPRKPVLRVFMLGSSVARPYLESLGTFRSHTPGLLMAICGVPTAGSHPQRQHTVYLQSVIFEECHLKITHSIPSLFSWLLSGFIIVPAIITIFL